MPGVRGGAQVNGPLPSSRPLATASSSNPWRRNTRGFTFQDEVNSGEMSLGQRDEACDA
jgi:hypothetical protein